ncbi:MAG: ATP-binding protein, partial [Chthoniobacterales bacterium]
MMLVVLAVTVVTVYFAERNRRAEQQRVLDSEFQNQVRSFLALQEARSAAITEKCRALSQAVRLRAALEERDVDDLYRNALTELQGMLEPSPDDTSEIRASFFRFFDADGHVLLPDNQPGLLSEGAPADAALAEMGRSLRQLDEQSIGFVALSRGDQPSALREVVLTKIRDWNGYHLGALAVGFPIGDMKRNNLERPDAMRSGIWLNQRFYVDGLTSLDRHQLARRIGAALQKNSNSHFTIDLESGPYLLFYKPLDPDTQLSPAFQVCLFPLAESIREEQILRWKITALGLVVLTCGFVASLFVAKNLSKPVEQIVAGSVENITLRKQAEENLRETNHELEKALEELKATQQQVIQQERLSAIGQMASGIAHDFNNTLTPILGFAELLLENERLLDNKVEARRCLKMLRTSAKDAANVVARLREFYRPAASDEEFPIVDLAKIVQQAVSLTEPKWRRQTQAEGVTVNVTAEIKAKPFVAGQESSLREVLTNLIFNAVDAMPRGGRIHLETSIENEQAVVRVRDNGTGMSEAVRQRCLEPFFSTKGDKGTGLGLSMVYGIVERHRGKLEIESVADQGTTFIIRLPLADDSLGQKSPQYISKKPNSALQVLVVDDEPGVLEIIQAYLRCDGHMVSTATSGREALEKFRHNNFDLVVVDRVMPEMT